jgi:hypothetical protein
MGHQPGQAPGTCLLNHLYLHGFSWAKGADAQLEQPLMLLFDHDHRHPIDKIWLAKLARCYLGKHAGRTLLSEKYLAYQTYKKDMNFNALADHSLLYSNELLFWLALHKAHDQVSQSNLEWFKINQATPSVGYEKITMWQIPPQSPHLQLPLKLVL